ncbi:hypothetical protein [Symmachiella dynata]|uniref:hypothetical protein n=1 Tax=Symmachiella dynata TaxID=2527995 RepID=UPI001E5396B5|nr:hypothetical protein [Symmachiella dynata]
MEQLETAGLTAEAARLREVAEQINRGILAERAELARQISELQHRSQQLRRLTGKPDQILCRCSILELSSKAFAEFEAAAEPVSSLAGPPNRTAAADSLSKNVVYKNAEEVIQRLKDSGQVSLIHAEPEIVTAPGKSATALSGGKFPIMIPQEGNRTSVAWSSFGVRCQVMPRLLDTGRIQLKFCPEICHLDFKHSVKVNGLSIPRLWMRIVNTQAELNLGETLVVSLISSSGSGEEDSLLPDMKTAVRWANGELDSAPPENTVTLFIVTPVAID